MLILNSFVPVFIFNSTGTFVPLKLEVALFTSEITFPILIPSGPNF